jgi:hypothetical protein
MSIHRFTLVVPHRPDLDGGTDPTQRVRDGSGYRPTVS